MPTLTEDSVPTDPAEIAFLKEVLRPLGPQHLPGGNVMASLILPTLFGIACPLASAYWLLCH